MPVANEHFYTCNFCQKRFKREANYLVHRCDEMKRREFFATPIGQSAWVLYQKWMKSYGRLVPNVNGFLHSKFFYCFGRFANFVRATKLVHIDLFISIMKDKDISPTIWTKDQVYSLYLEYIDKKLSPEKHAEITVNTLLDFADDQDIDVSDVFTTISPIEVIDLLRERKLSPWLLLNSQKFKQFLMEKSSGQQRIILESLIRPSYWKGKFLSRPDLVEQMKKYVSELKL